MDANQTAATATPAAAPAAAAAAGAQRTARGGSGGGGRGGRGGGHSSNGPRPSTGAVAPSPAAASAAGATSAAAASRPPVASAAASASASGASGASAAALSCVSVSSLEPDAKGKNLIVQVREMRLVVQSKQVKIVEALVGDKTGTVWLVLKNAQSDSITLGQWLILRGAHIQMFRSQMRLAITPRVGSIDPCPAAQQPASAQIKLDNNVSESSWELVAAPA